MNIMLGQLGTFETGVFDDGAAEIVAHDPDTQRLFVTNGNAGTVDVLDISVPETPTLVNQITVGNLTSVAVSNGLVVIASPNDDDNLAGSVLLFDADGNLLNTVEVGVLPDSLTFTPDGNRILVANEGEPTDTSDPLGSISIIDVSAGAAAATVNTLDFTGFDGREKEFSEKGVRLFPGNSVSEDVEPEFIAVSPDGTQAFVTLQENNAVAVLDLETETITDILPLGVKDFSRGLPSLEQFEFTDLPLLGTDANGLEIDLGGFSGLHHVGTDEVTGVMSFITVPDRGPNGGEVVDGARTFNLPDYQARYVSFDLDPATGEITITDQTFFTREDGVTPISGLPNIEGFDEIPVDAAGTELSYDAFGADMEGIVIANDGTLWTVDEYRPAIYHFEADGTLIDRFVPEGIAAIATDVNPDGTVFNPGDFGTETLPEEYAERRTNRGFEAVAYDEDANVIYAFIQTPMANPDRATSDASDIIRILGIDAGTGEPVSEYVYLLEDADQRSGGRVDKIGDAVYAGDGKFYVIERDSTLGDETGKKFIFEVDLTGATNVLGFGFGAETLEQQSAEVLELLSVEPVNKIKVANLPSLGYLASDKPEGLTLLPDGSLAVLNDNDFGIEDATGLVPTLGIISFDQSNGLDASDRDDGINIDNEPVFGMFMPDSIASFEADGRTFYVTANEGDARDEDARIADLTLDPDAFPDAATLQLDENLGRLDASTIDGDLDGDGDFDQLFIYGGRSFTIFDDQGNLVFDSGDQFEQIIADLIDLGELPEDAFNANNDDNDSFESRSDNKGPEPEGVAVGEIGGHTYAFVGLERVGGIMVYDISEPTSPDFVQYINNRNFEADAETSEALDLAPEGLTFISAEDSPNGKPILAVANEVSGTTTLFSIDLTPTIMEIQGEGHVSEFDGEMVTTTGIITAIDIDGFYIQDPNGDGNDNTSDAILVFESFGNVPGELEIGDEVQVTGVVTEFQARAGELSVTQIRNSDEILVLSSGNDLPEAVLIGANGRSQSDDTVISPDEEPVSLIDPAQDAANTFDPENDAIDFFESLEGMLVTVDDPVAVAPTRVFSFFSSEFVVVADDGANTSPGLNDRGGINLNSDENNIGDQNPERIQIQFDQDLFSGDEFIPFPVNVGDNLSDITGVVGYSFGNFEVNATEDFFVETPTSNVQEVTDLTGSDTQLTVASYNVLNLDPSDSDGDATDNDQFDLLARQISSNLGLPDIIALQEIQDNTGTTDNDGELDADQTLQALVDAIAAESGLTYEFATLNPPEANAFGGQPGGNIRNAFLYNTDRVTLDDASLKLLSPEELADAGVADNTAFADNAARSPLVATFDFNGEDVTVVNNHFSSRFGSTPIFGEQQPFVQAGEEAREAQSQAINDYVDSLLATDANANIIVAGDLNTFEFTNDLAEILPGTGDEQVLTNLVTASLEGDEAYTFNFEGNSQVLDHMFVTDGLLANAEFDIVHLNNDFARDDNRAVLTDQIVASDHEPIIGRFEFAPIEPDSFTLQILHASDLEGGVDAIERAPNFAAIIDNLEDDFDNTVILSSGDNVIPGPFFNAAGDRDLRDDFQALYQELFGEPGLDNIREGSGRADISIMNIIGFDASVLGNHEFDAGTNALADFIATDIRGTELGDVRWLGAQFPYLSANLDFSGDANLADLFADPDVVGYLNSDEFKADLADLAATAAAPKIAPATIIEEGGEQIGVVGATTPLLASLSSPGDTTVQDPGAGTNDMAALASILQPVIDDLIAQGINKIIVVSHLQQLSLEQELAGLLNGVDVIIAGGSDTLLADDNDVLRPGDVAEGPYPIETTNADGDPLLIVNTDGEYSYVGRLVLEFDAEGRVITESLDDEINGAYATTDEVVTELFGAEDPFADGTKGGQVKALTDAVQEVVTEVDGNILGRTDVFLEGRREAVRTEETNIGNLTADANLALAQDVDPTVLVSIKNGGGLRAPIGEIDGLTGELLPPPANPAAGKEAGDISQLDVENTLRFNNSLTLLTVTAAELLAIVEHGFAATVPGATPGQFPQIGGMELSFDPDAPSGERIRSLAIVDEDGSVLDVVAADGQIIGDETREIRLVTLNFLADGGDGYPFPEFGTDRVDLPDLGLDEGLANFTDAGTEQDALAEYLLANFSETPFGETETSPELDERIQNLNERGDTVLDGFLLGTDEGELIRGTDDDDDIFGLGGDDDIRARDGDDNVSGGSGDDDIWGLRGDDNLSGDDGDDFIRGGRGDDDIFGGDGDDDLGGGRDDDTVYGGEGDDYIGGDKGDDDLFGGAGDDEIRGDRGDDLIVGGTGSDDLRGGRGDDIFQFAAGDGSDIIRDFKIGSDTIDVSAFGFASFDDITIEAVNANRTLVTFDADAMDEVLLIGIRSGDLGRDDFELG